MPTHKRDRHDDQYHECTHEHTDKHKKTDEESAKSEVEEAIKSDLVKLIKMNINAKDEISDLFQVLDDGYEVDLRGLENKDTKEYLYSIMKNLRLDRGIDNKYRITKPIANKTALMPKIKAYIDEINHNNKKVEEESHKQDQKKEPEKKNAEAVAEPIEIVIGPVPPCEGAKEVSNADDYIHSILNPPTIKEVQKEHYSATPRLNRMMINS